MSTHYHVMTYNVPDADLEQETIEVAETHDLPGVIAAKIAEQVGARLGYDVGVQLCNELGSPLTIRRYIAADDDIDSKVGTATVNAHARP